MEAPEKIYIPTILAANTVRYKADGSNEYIRTDVFIEKAKEAFCKVRCNGKPPRDTCTSLGTCDEYDDFCKTIKKELL